MKKSYIYAVWAVLYCLCAGLGFVREPEGVGKTLLIACSFIFFMPPFLMAWVASKSEDRQTLKELRIISLIALGLTLLLLVLNFLSVYMNAQSGLVLYVLLVLFTAPMVCGQYWAMPIFMWACLLMVSLRRPEPK